MDSDKSANALGPLHFAHSHWISAVALQAVKLDLTHKDAPGDYLYYHVIELYPKAFLRLQGQTLAKVRAFRHNLPDLYDEAVAKGLEDSVFRREVVALVPDNYRPARYIQTGYFQKAPWYALREVCSSLPAYAMRHRRSKSWHRDLKVETPCRSQVSPCKSLHSQKVG